METPALYGVNAEGEQDEHSNDHQQDGARKRVKVRVCGGCHLAMVTCWGALDTGLSRRVTQQSGIRSNGRSKG
jgi:hypothetical protein